MFCKNCGQEIDDKAVVCPHCGVQVAPIVQPQEYINEPEKKGNTIAIVGFIFAFLIPIVGLVCCILGYNNAKKYEAPYKSLALAGIIISIVVWILNIIVSAAMSSVLFG